MNPLDRARAWWRGLPRNQQIAFGVGVPAVVALVLWQRMQDQATAGRRAAGASSASGGGRTGSVAAGIGAQVPASGGASFGGGGDPYAGQQAIVEQLRAVQASQQQANAANEEAIVGGLSALEGYATQLQQQQNLQYDQIVQQLQQQQTALAQQATPSTTSSNQTATSTPGTSYGDAGYQLRRLSGGQVLGTYPTRLACSQAAQAADPNSSPPGSSLGCYAI